MARHDDADKPGSALQPFEFIEQFRDNPPR
jgi:hypothetical protein